MNKLSRYLFLLLVSLVAWPCVAQTNFAVLATDGAWTWYNDPRAVFHNGALYFGYVRNSDGKSALSSLQLQTGKRTELWSSALAQKDDHNNPALLVKQDGHLLAIHARHGSDPFFSYRLSSTTNPIAPINWSQEFTSTNSGGVTYANPFQLSGESGRIYNYMRNQNFNPTVVSSTNGGQTWSSALHFIKTGTGGTRPYVKYCSDYAERIDFLYTDGHPRNENNSLYHIFYRQGAYYTTEGTLVKNYADLPILHDSGERGSVIYQYSDVPTNDPNAHIPTGRAWCTEITYQTNGAPVALFTVQRDNVTVSNWTGDRIYYYYARWTGSNWQKRFIAHAGRPLYESEDDYPGGICTDPENSNIIYISSNAQNPFDLTTTTNVPLRANSRYELYRGITSDGGLTFSWEVITTNSTKDNLRPYMPRRHNGATAVIWFRGTYTTFTSYNCEIVGLFSTSIPRTPQVSISSPTNSLVWMTNSGNKLKLSAVVVDDELPQAPSLLWSTAAGPTNAVFLTPNSTSSFAEFSMPGTYTLRIIADDTLASSFAETTVVVGNEALEQADASRVMCLKFDETSGGVAQDSSGSGNAGAISGPVVWNATNGMRAGAIELDGATAQVVVPDAPALDSTAAFTLAYWFKANNYLVDSAGLVSKRLNVADNNAYTTYLKSTDRRIYVDIVGGDNRFSSSTSISTGLWYHVALVFNGSLPVAQRAQLWINGDLDVTASESSVTIPDYTSSVRIGNTHPGATNWFSGSFDDVQFLRRPLSGAEIKLLAVRHRTPTVFAGSAPAVYSGVIGTLSGSVLNGTTSAAVSSWSQSGGPGNALFGNSNSPASTVRFSRGGTYVLRLQAEDPLATVARDLVVSVGANTNVFEDWAAFYLTEGMRSEMADPDVDGVANIFEFAFGMNPTQDDAFAFSPSSAGVGKASIENFGGTNFLSLKVKRPTGRLGITYAGQASADLAIWEVAFQQGSPADNGDGTEILTLRDFVPREQAPQRFLRLQVSRQF